MIISFAGRCRSGKTELAKICEKYGYKKLYFALPLKLLCADILDIGIDGLNEAKVNNTDISLYLGDDICEILSDKTDIPLENVKETCFGKVLHNVREMLQFIGTDLIRHYNADWHVGRIKKMINPNINYVIDDVRFPNEKKMVESLGGDCWFVTRTTLDNISNHESETSITWKDCLNKIIINDSTLQNLKFRWETFMDNYENSCTIRNKEFNRILENGIENKLKPMSMLDVLMLSKSLFTYVPKDFSNVIKATMNEDRTVLVKYNDGSHEIIENQLNIEDLKIFL